MSDRGAQRACARLATGALEVFAVDPQSSIYKQAAGDLEVFAVDPRSTIYKRTTEFTEQSIPRLNTTI
ncbi:hypothetical protein [Halorubrum sp. T3]|uniref:hypothetical protein n=1 Tax=Halorubrum sp. T3 TaxID=1194088 RepID=UPI0009E3969C|nr:hypothetical protein [Halorubrum sp. T3]